ncbi:hypothetical protein WDU99_14260 [Microbacterium sp. Mu-80]|uniref:Lipoprotein n=1 Tax=Microbacterium bandirmense TaxID=3122050 RepID=A0ABU8LES8_9MICO
MKWISGCVLVAFGVLMLAGCSSATATSAEVQQWMSDRSAESGDSLASMAGLALKASDVADRTLDDLGDQVRIDFGEPVRIADVEFTCFGAEVMDVSVYAESGSGVVGTGATDVRCDDGIIGIDTGVDDRVSALAVVGISEAGAGAWAVTVR